MSLAVIIALLAFFVALVALWLTSDVVKKVEGQNDKFVRAHLTTLREDLRDMNEKFQKTVQMSKGQGEGQKALDKRLNEHTVALDDVRARIALLSARFDELDRSIPPRYRVRVVKADAKADTKPSIQ